MAMPRLSTAFILLLFLLLCAVSLLCRGVNAQQEQNDSGDNKGQGGGPGSHGAFNSPDFYQMVDDVTRNVDYYAIVGISDTDRANLTSKSVKSAFKKLSLRLHPDKNPAPDAAEKYQQLVFAASVLGDPEKRAMYDSYRTEGIPWHEKYYGKYAHKYGAPEHDIRWVLFWTLLVVTIGHYLYRRHRYYYIKSMVKRTRKYQEAQKQLSGGKKNKKKPGSTQEEEDDVDEPEPHLIGVSLPTWKDLLVVRLVMLPYHIGYFIFSIGRWLIYYKLLGNKPPEIDRETWLKQRYPGLTDEHIAQYRRKVADYERAQKRKQPNRFSRSR